MEKLGLNECTIYKNGSDIQFCIEAKSLILPGKPLYLRILENRRLSGSKWTHHLNVRYFFVTDRSQGSIFPKTGGLLYKSLQGTSLRKCEKSVHQAKTLE